MSAVGSCLGSNAAASVEPARIISTGTGKGTGTGVGVGVCSWGQGRNSLTHLFAQRLELLGIDVLPYALHIVPVGDNAVLERIADLEQPPQLLRSLADEDVSLQSSSEHAQVFRPPDKRREEAFGSIFTREPGSDGAAAVVEDNGRVVQCVAHCGCWCEVGLGRPGWVLRMTGSGGDGLGLGLGLGLLRRARCRREWIDGLMD